MPSKKELHQRRHVFLRIRRGGLFKDFLCCRLQPVAAQKIDDSVTHRVILRSAFYQRSYAALRFRKASELNIEPLTRELEISVCWLLGNQLIIEPGSFRQVSFECG